MEPEITYFTEPEELVEWTEEYDILMHIPLEDARLILDILECHEYFIGSDSSGKLYRWDTNADECIEYPIDDVILFVYELQCDILDEAEDNKEHPDGKKEYEESLAINKRLDRLFMKTSYGKEWQELIDRSKRNENAKTELVVSEKVKPYQTERRGR